MARGACVEDLEDVVAGARLPVGVAGVDHDRQAALAGGMDMHPKDVRLHVAGTVVVVVIEAAFPDPDHPGMRGPGDQLTRPVRRLLACPVGMHPDRAVDVRVGLGDRQDLGEGIEALDVREAWRAAYADSPAVEVRSEGAPALAEVVNTDRLALGVVDNTGLTSPLLTVVAALDNLGKGAAGQAVQNMNLMMGFDPGMGLRC